MLKVRVYFVDGSVQQVTDARSYADGLLGNPSFATTIGYGTTGGLPTAAVTSPKANALIPTGATSCPVTTCVPTSWRYPTGSSGLW